MKLHNPLTGVQVSVEDEDGDRMLAAGGWAKGDTPKDWVAPRPGESPEFTTSASKPKPAAKSSGTAPADN